MRETPSLSYFFHLGTVQLTDPGKIGYGVYIYTLIIWDPTLPVMWTNWTRSNDRPQSGASSSYPWTTSVTSLLEQLLEPLQTRRHIQRLYIAFMCKILHGQVVVVMANFNCTSQISSTSTTSLLGSSFT